MPVEGTKRGTVRSRLLGQVSLRFTKYSALSLLTVPVGYTLLVTSMHIWHAPAWVLNLCVGNVLTPPSFLLYRWLVWREGSGRGMARELFSFWQTVMVGALASSATIAIAEYTLGRADALVVLAALTGQGIIFIARFVWLDLVTFSKRKLSSRIGRAHGSPDEPATTDEEPMATGEEPMARPSYSPVH